MEIRKQLRGICENLKLPLESCRQDTNSIRKCLCAGFFMNAAELQREGEYISVSMRAVSHRKGEYSFARMSIELGKNTNEAELQRE